MKIWSDSFKDGAAIKPAYAFAQYDGAVHARLAGNRNPHLAWDDVPNGTQSLLLLCIDGDAPDDVRDANREGATIAPAVPRSDFFHWILADLPPRAGSIVAGRYADGVTARGKQQPHVGWNGADGVAVALRQGINDYTRWFAGDAAMAGDYYGYDGPCPPWNDARVHHYVFRLYALDVPALDLPARFDGRDAWAAVQGHILDETQLIATYTLNPLAGAA